MIVPSSKSAKKTRKKDALAHTSVLCPPNARSKAGSPRQYHFLLHPNACLCVDVSTTNDALLWGERKLSTQLDP